MMQMMLERHEVKERCCGCVERVEPGGIKAQGDIEARAAVHAGVEESLRPARWGWTGVREQRRHCARGVGWAGGGFLTLDGVYMLLYDFVRDGGLTTDTQNYAIRIPGQVHLYVHAGRDFPTQHSIPYTAQVVSE